MITFSPPELREQLVKAKELLDEVAHWHFYPVDQDFDREEYNDDNVTMESDFELELFSALDSITITVEDALQFAEWLKHGRVINRGMVTVPGQTIIYIEPVNEKAQGLVYEKSPCSISSFEIECNYISNGTACTIDMIEYINPFNILAEKYFELHRKSYASFGEHDVFVEITYEGTISQVDAQ